MDKTSKGEGTKMIKVCVYFHTTLNGVTLPPKTVYPRGKVVMPTNHRHGIRASDANMVYFGKSQPNLMSAIKDCLKQHNIKVINENKIKDFKKFLKMQRDEDFFNKEIDI